MVSSVKGNVTIAIASAAVVGLAGCSGSSGSGSSGGSDAPSDATRSSAAARSTAHDPAAGSSTVSSRGGSSAASGDRALADPYADLATTGFPVSMSRAISIAGKQLPGATMTKLGLEFDKNARRWVWKIDEQKGTKQRELTIDAGSGRVISGEHDEESGSPRAVDPKKLSPRAAIKKATGLVPGTIADWALEYDDGVQRYEIQVRTHGADTHDVIVPVETGKARRG